MKKWLSGSISMIMVIFVAALPSYSSSRVQKESESYTYIVLPDTQFYSEKYPQLLESQVDWIVEEKNRLNIKAVIFLGDLVQTAQDQRQWVFFEKMFRQLEELNIPIVPGRGNHDHLFVKQGGGGGVAENDVPPANNTQKDEQYYNQYFPVSRFMKKPWFGGAFKNSMSTSYFVLRDEGKQTVIGAIDYCPSKEEIKWMNDVFTKYKDSELMLETHALTNRAGEFNVHGCGDTSFIWNDLIKQHKNLKLVFNGHTSGESLRVEKNLYKEDVNLILADYQSETMGGNAWLRIVTFFPKQNKVTVKTYSPYLKKFSVDSGNVNIQGDFELTYSSP